MIFDMGASSEVENSHFGTIAERGMNITSRAMPKVLAPNLNDSAILRDA
jgi:hypothetical protein